MGSVVGSVGKNWIAGPGFLAEVSFVQPLIITKCVVLGNVTACRTGLPGPGPSLRLVLPGGGRDRVPVSLVTVVRHITVSVSRTTQLP